MAGKTTDSPNMPRDDAGHCAVRAIVTTHGLHLEGSDHSDRQKWTQHNRAQRRRNGAAMALLEETGLHTGPVGPQELATLAEAPNLRDYRIVVVDANRQYACFVFGQGATLLAILHKDEHYDTVTTLPGFFAQGYFRGATNRTIKKVDPEELEDRALIVQIDKLSVLRHATTPILLRRARRRRRRTIPTTHRYSSFGIRKACKIRACKCLIW